MPYFFVSMLAPLGIVIALYRRNPRRFLDGPTEDAPTRLLRWAVSLLSPERAEWGQAMLGELGHVDGRFRRMRFAVGCTGAALVLPPWGAAAAGAWAMIALATGSLGLFAGLTVHYRLGGGDWVALAVVAILCVGFLLGASALLRRPGVAWPGLLGGLVATVVTLSLSGFTFVDQVSFIPKPWQQWVTVILLPAAVGAAGTLWNRDPAAGRRVARLAALSAGLLRLFYGTITVAVLGGGGPPDQDGGFTLRGTISDRLGNNIVDLVIGSLIIAVVGWAAAALTGRLIGRSVRRELAPAASDLEPQPEA
jgi:hypothetical protein